MTTDERIITAVSVNNEAYVAGQDFDKLLDLTMRSGVTVEEVFGDKAYFRKPILDRIQDIGAKPYIPVSEMAYRNNEDLYSFSRCIVERLMNAVLSGAIGNLMNQENRPHLNPDPSLIKHHAKDTISIFYEVIECLLNPG